MSTDIMKPKLVTVVAERYGLDPEKFIQTIEKTIFPGGSKPSTEQVAAFLAVANEYNLNIFTREIYAFPGRSGGVVPVVSIDGWSKLMNSHPKFDGIEFEERFDDQNVCTAITVTVYRKDRNHPTKITEYMNECRRNTDPWKSHPIRMLRHKALIQAARVVFGFAGIYDPDEAERILASEDGIGRVEVDDGRSRSAKLADKLSETFKPVESKPEEGSTTDPKTEPEPLSVCALCGKTGEPLIEIDKGFVCSKCAHPKEEVMEESKSKPRKAKSKSEPEVVVEPVKTSGGDFDIPGRALWDKCQGIVRHVQFPKRLLQDESNPAPDGVKIAVFESELNRLHQEPPKKNLSKSWLNVDDYHLLNVGTLDCFIKVLQAVPTKSEK